MKTIYEYYDENTGEFKMTKQTKNKLEKYHKRAKKAWDTRKENKKNKNRNRALKAWKTMRKRGFVTKKQKKDLYNNKRKENQRKILVNLIKEKKELFNKSNPLRRSNLYPKIIYLDSPKLYFTKLLDKEEINNDFSLIIPNNKEFYKFHHSRRWNIWGQTQIQYEEHINKDYYKPLHHIVLENKSFKDYILNGSPIDNKEDMYFNTFFIWADYCGSFSSYLEDIELVFKNKVLGNNSIFAMTFNRRDVARKQKIPNYSTTNCIVAVNDYVSKLAKKYGYKVELHKDSGFYKATMFTAIFIVEHKYITKNQEQIEKALETYNNLISDLKSQMSSQFNEIENKIITEGG